MALGMEVGLGPVHIVYCVEWGHSFPPPNGEEPCQIFGPSLLWPNGWMHEDVTWYGGRPRLTRHCV